MCNKSSFLQRPLSKGEVVIKPITLLFLTSLLSTPLVFAEFIEESELPPPEPTVEQILAEEHRARVIVGLDDSYLVKGPSTRSSGNSSGSPVESLQNAFVQDLEEKGFIGLTDSAEDVVKTKFNSIPALVMEVNPFLFEGIKDHPLVNKIEVDRLYSAALFESIPLIGADKAWLQNYSGSGQVIAIIDKGIDKTHPALAGKVIEEFEACFSTNEVDKESLCPDGSEEQIGEDSAVPCGDQGCDHGTHVAGIAAANGTINKGTNKETTVEGVAKDAQLIAIQVFSRVYNDEVCKGKSPCLRTYESNIIRALEYVLKLYYEEEMTNIASANLSLGAGIYSELCDEDHPAMTTAINNLREVGIASIISAGNNQVANGISAPACISTAISVGATCDMVNNGTEPAYNYYCSGGTDTVTLFSNNASSLDLLAPGMWITSAVPGGLGTKAGTSMAAPLVAGAWGVLKSIYPDASVDQVLSILEQTGVPVLDTRNGLTKPRIQLDKAAKQLVELTQVKPPLATTLPSLAVVTEEEGFKFMWEQAAELDSGGGMNLVCAKMESGTFTEPVKINQTLKAAMDEAFYPSGGVKGVKYCTLEEINAAGVCTLHCDATVVISDEPSAISDVKTATKLCRQYAKNLAQTKSCLNF